MVQGMVARSLLAMARFVPPRISDGLYEIVKLAMKRRWAESRYTGEITNAHRPCAPDPERSHLLREKIGPIEQLNCSIP